MSQSVLKMSMLETLKGSQYFTNFIKLTTQIQKNKDCDKLICQDRLPDSLQINATQGSVKLEPSKLVKRSK